LPNDVVCTTVRLASLADVCRCAHATAGAL